MKSYIIQKIIDTTFKNPTFSTFFRKKFQNNFISEKGVVMKYIVGNQGRVLDFGCGSGDFCSLINKNFYYGVDIDDRFIKYAKKVHKEYNFIKVIKDHNLPFSNNYFKKILALGVFHHISDEGVNNILKDFDRMLLPNGEIIIIDQLHHTGQENLLAKIMVKHDRGKFLRRNNHLRRVFNTNFNIKENYKISCGPFTMCVFILARKSIKKLHN